MTACNQAFDTNIVFRQVQEQVQRYNNDKNNSNQNMENIQLPQSMQLRSCMIRAIQNQLIDDTIIIPVYCNISTNNTTDDTTTTTTTTANSVPNTDNIDATIAPNINLQDEEDTEATTSSMASTEITKTPQQPPLRPMSSPSSSSSPQQQQQEQRINISPRSWKRMIRRSRSVSIGSVGDHESVLSSTMNLAADTSFTQQQQQQHHHITIQKGTAMRFSSLYNNNNNNSNENLSESQLQQSLRPPVAVVCGTIGSIVLVIRRPGCSLCQQQAYELTSLCQLYPEYFLTSNTNKESSTEKPMFTIYGIVKDMYDTTGIIQCQATYFPYPIYINPSLTFYHILGDRKLSLSQILFTGASLHLTIKTIVCNMIHGNNTNNTTTKLTKNEQQASYSNPLTDTTSTTDTMPSVSTTTTTATTKGSTSNLPVSATTTTITNEDNLSNNYKSDGVLQGGIIFFQTTPKQQQQPIAMYPEETGQSLNMSNILRTIQYMIQQHTLKEACRQ